MDKYLTKIKSVLDNNGFDRASIHESAKMIFEARKSKYPANPPKEANDPTTKEGISNALASEFFARCRALATSTHFAHLSTDSFSEHTALATFYEELVEGIDAFCEAYIGKFGKFITLPPIDATMDPAVDLILELLEWIDKNRNLITEDSSLQNIIDEISTLCNTTVYKLQKLK
jgi:hypothetical protein